MNYLRNFLHFHLICFESISLQTIRFKFRRKQNIVVHDFLLGLFFVLNNYFEMNRNWWILVIEIVFK